MLQAGRFDRTAVAPMAGAVAALPVAALFGIGLAIGGARLGVALGVGAHLVAVVSRKESIRSPFVVLLVVTVAMGLAAFTGSITAGVPALHIAALALWCLAGGLLVALGPARQTIGIQALIVFIIFGRLPASPAAALGLAALIALGAAIETLWLAIVRWPPPLRVERDAVAHALEALAALSLSDPDTPTIAAGAAIDRATGLLSSPSLFSRADVAALQALADEGRRMRMEISGLSGVRRRLSSLRRGSTESHCDPSAIGAARQRLSDALRVAAGLVARPARDRDLSSLARAIEALEVAVAAIGADAHSTDEAGLLMERARQHLQVLADQLRVAERLVPRLGTAMSPDRERNVRPLVTATASGLREDGRTLGANLSLSSPAMRHAVRLAVVVPVAAIVAAGLGLPRGYWVPLSATVILMPTFSGVFSRGAARVLGTCVGVGIAGVVAAAVHPTPPVAVLLVAVAAWGCYSFYQSNYAVAATFLTALVLFMLSVTETNTMAAAGDRVLDTVIGGALALAAYLVWPTTTSRRIGPSLASGVDAALRYLEAMFDVVAGRARKDQDRLDALGRGARLAWAGAEATVNRALSEPDGRRLNMDLVNGVLCSLRRLIQTTHSLACVAAPLEGDRVGGFLALADVAEDDLRVVAARLRGDDRVPPVKALCPLHRSVRAALDGDHSALPLMVDVDEVVAAIETLGVVVPDQPVLVR